MFTIEAGINHFGSINEANKIVNFFLKSSFKQLTFMIHSQSFYEKYKNKGINFELPINFYVSLIKKFKLHKNKKKIGLAVCDLNSFKKLQHLNFDFYKLLSVSINNFQLIDNLKKKRKPVYVSTGFNSTNIQIKKCLKRFYDKKKIVLLHTPMTYKINELNFDRIVDLRKKFKLDVGYSNHCNDFNTLNILSLYRPKNIFLYCKFLRKKNRIYPDNDHSVYLEDLENIKKNYTNYLLLKTNKNKIKKINIFKDGIKK